MFTWLTTRFDKWFYRNVKNAWDNKDIYETEALENGYVGLNKQMKKFNTTPRKNGSYAMINEEPISSLHSEATLNFTLHPATGGYILQFSTYNITKDERHTKLHIITTDQDLGERIGQIISFELLRS
jgi:hypothetical protein